MADTTANPLAERLQGIIEQHLTSVYACTRVWEAWSVGTMTQDDFVPAGETEFARDLAAELATAISSSPAAVPPCWYIEYGKYGHITLRKEEADAALANGAVSVTAYSHAAHQPTRATKAAALPRFPTVLRKMWSGGEIQAWIDENWSEPDTACSTRKSEEVDEHARRWSENRSQIIDAIRAQGFALVQNVHGWSLLKLGPIVAASAAPKQAQAELATAENTCKLTECQGQPRCKPCLARDARSKPVDDPRKRGAVVVDDEILSIEMDGESYSVEQVRAALHAVDQPAALARYEEFEDWWQKEGQFSRAGGGDYEKTFAFNAWQTIIARQPEALPATTKEVNS